MKKMSPEAERLFLKILKIGPSYFDEAVPLHEREIEICDAMLRTKSVAKIRRLQAELQAVTEQINAIGETRQ
jgi:hypothetical protein